MISILSLTGHDLVACLTLAPRAARQASIWHLCCMNKHGEVQQDSLHPCAVAGTETPWLGPCTQRSPPECHFLLGSRHSNSLPPPVASEEPYTSQYVNCASATWPTAWISHVGLIRKADGLTAPLHIFPGKCLFREYPRARKVISCRPKTSMWITTEYNTRHICFINKWLYAESFKAAQCKYQPCQISPQIYPQRGSEYDSTLGTI